MTGGRLAASHLQRALCDEQGTVQAAHQQVAIKQWSFIVN
jgi:hypothetical protein